MIRVTIELLPHGSELHKRHMGTAIISNDGTGDWESGNYKVTLSKWGKPKVTWKKGTITDFDRKKRGPWDLLYLALHGIVGGRNRQK